MIKKNNISLIKAVAAPVFFFFFILFYFISFFEGGIKGAKWVSKGVKIKQKWLIFAIFLLTAGEVGAEPPMGECPP